MLKVKTHYEKIGKDRVFTFYVEDVSTNTLIYSSTFLVCKQNKKDFNKLKSEFVDYVKGMQEMELAMLEAKTHSLDEVKHIIPLNISNNSNNIN